MKLPDSVRRCMDRLVDGGYSTYVVGGGVRDACLGLTPHDYDLCTAALPEEIQRIFADHSLVLAGVKHGTVGVITENGVVEITTFRQEGDYSDSRHPAWVQFVPNVEADLARRDFTVNAMAYSPTLGFADPFGGREDLKNGILRAVGDPAARFQEDALRILRGVRFAVRFHLTVEPETEKAMNALAWRIDKLARERVFEELCQLLPLVNAQDLIRFAPVITEAIPEMKPMVGFDQHSPHHAYDVYTHTALVTEGVPGQLVVRWAALLHDVGKPANFSLDAEGRGHFIGHAQKGAQIADGILLRLKAPTALRQQVVLLIAQHMTLLAPDKKLLRRRLAQYGWQTVQFLLDLQRADFGNKGVLGVTPDFDGIQQLLQVIAQENACLSLKDLAVNGNDLLALGYTGRQIGIRLNRLLELVLEEKCENTKPALLAALKNLQQTGGDDHT